MLVENFQKLNKKSIKNVLTLALYGVIIEIASE